MFTRYYVYLDRPATAVEAELLRDPGLWVPVVVREVHESEWRLLGSLGVDITDLPPADAGPIEIHEPARRPDGTFVLPVAWRAGGGEAPFPAVEADLEVSPLGPGRCQLGLRASYQRAAAGIARALDTATLTRVADASAKDFVERAASLLGRRLDLLA